MVQLAHMSLQRRVSLSSKGTDVRFQLQQAPSCHQLQQNRPTPNLDGQQVLCVGINHQLQFVHCTFALHLGVAKDRRGLGEVRRAEEVATQFRVGGLPFPIYSR